MSGPRQGLAKRMRRQSRACARLGSPLYAGLLEQVADDVEAGGPSWEVLRGHELPPGSSPALRLMGAVNRIVLEGRSPDLARLYPTGDCERVEDTRALWPVFRAVLVEHSEELRRRMPDPVQTNEVGRAAALLGGFALVADTTGLPLRVLEIGASAGLNLRFDRFAYEIAGKCVGDPSSPVRIAGAFEGSQPPVDVSPEVVERRGCDTRPIDPASSEGRLTLLSYVWPDQRERVRLLEGAIEVARRVPAAVDEEPASSWLEGRLEQQGPDAATVVFHSIVTQYLDASERDALEQLLGEAAARATAEQPLVRLAMERAGELADVRLTIWPGGEERLIARAGYHGRPVRWVVADSTVDDGPGTA
ncbi:MAG: DUF2332 domain-containing protein [Actinomycetota bacterium]|nr:DUF2332 domain-containing protein [Actinomycetota bacterium]